MVEAEAQVEMISKPWSMWMEEIGVDNQTKQDTNYFMKLPKEEMDTFGKFPALDSFVLVKCEQCNNVVKIQALKTHMEKQHEDYLAQDISPGNDTKKERISGSVLEPIRMAFQKQDGRWQVKKAQESFAAGSG